MRAKGSRLYQNLKSPHEVSAQTYTVKRVIRHKSFNINTLFHDVAILSLSQEVGFDVGKQAICLDRQPRHNFVNTIVQVAGWGATRAGSATRGGAQQLSTSLKVTNF